MRGLFEDYMKRMYCRNVNAVSAVDRLLGRRRVIAEPGGRPRLYSDSGSVAVGSVLPLVHEGDAVGDLRV